MSCASGSPEASSSSNHVRPRSLVSASWPRGPCAVELATQLILVDKAIEDSRRRALRRGQQCQYRASAALAICLPSTAEDALAILKQRPKIADPIAVVSETRFNRLTPPSDG